MKRERLFTFLEATVIGFFLSFTAVACMVTAFDMSRVDLGQLALYCAGGAAVCSFLCSRRLGLLMLGLTALAAGILWQNGTLEDGFEALLYKLSGVYHDAYGWQILRWSDRSSTGMARSLVPFIYVLGTALACLSAWTVCKGQSSIVACVPAALPVISCFVVTDSLPDTVWLVLFLTVTGVMILTSTTRQTDRAQGRQLALYTVLPVFLAVGVLFLAIPQETYHRQSQAQAIEDFLLGRHSLEQMLDRLTGKPVMTGEKKVDLTAVGARRDNPAKVLEVKSRYRTGALYLRTTALDQYTGTQWYDSETPLTELYWPEKPDAVQINEVQIKTQYAHEMLYLPYYPMGMDISSMTRGMVNTRKLNEYTITQMLREPWEVEYASDRTTISENQRLQMRELTQLPESTQQWAEPLARSIVGELTDPYYQALAIADYVQNSARYDQNTGTMPADSGDFAQWFLEESDTGYCIHYATAGAVLLKSLGIPARYVTGYLVEAKALQITDVLASDAHAWVEYWLPGYGWAMLECTPPTTEDDPDPQPQPGTIQQPDTKPQADTPAPTGSEPENGGYSWLWLALIPGGIFGLWVQGPVRRCIRKRRCDRGDPNARALAKWAEAERLSRHLKQQPPEALLCLAEKAKFSPYTIADTELAAFDEYLRQAKAALKKKNFFCRLWYRWVLALY